MSDFTVTPEFEVDRTLPHAELDGADVDPRLTRYREQAVVNFVNTKHPLADEGTYFTTNNAQTGVATAAAPTAFSGTNPFLVIYNTASPSDDFAQRIYVDYMTLIATAAGTAAASVQFAAVLDRATRYTSGGTELTANIKGVNMSVSRATIARVWAGNITASAASINARTIVGNRFMKGAIPVIGDTYTVRCGTTDVIDMIGVSTVVFSTNNIPPLIVGPDETLTIHLWFPSQSAASSYAPELGWWER